MTTRSLLKIFVILILPLLFCMPVWAETSFELEFDPYYTNAGYYIGFGDKVIPEIVVRDDTPVFERMLNSIFTMPQSLLFEASINPLPVLGIYIKKNHQDSYEDAQVSGDLNMVQALTEGFEEPYALSLFLGSIVRFVEPGGTGVIKNRGYSGYLLNAGDKHIVNNELVDDNWYEFEMKIKGDQDFEDKVFSWSIRAGVKSHDNRDIADVYYFAFRGNHFDNKSDSFSFRDNSDIEYKVDFNQDGSGLVQQELFINKKWPTFLSAKSAFSLGIGLIIEKAKYSGQLTRQSDDTRIIIRPNFQF